MKLLITLFIYFVFSFSALGQVKKGNTKRGAKKSIKQEKIIDYSEDYDDQWLFYAKSGISSFYFNPARTTRSGSVFKVWTEQRDNTDEIVIGKVLLEINCSTQKMRSIAQAEYYTIVNYPNGKESKIKSFSSSDNPNAKFSVIFPDTAGDVLSKKLCKSINL